MIVHVINLQVGLWSHNNSVAAAAMRVTGAVLQASFNLLVQQVPFQPDAVVISSSSSSHRLHPLQGVKQQQQQQQQPQSPEDWLHSTMAAWAPAHQQQQQQLALSAGIGLSIPAVSAAAMPGALPQQRCLDAPAWISLLRSVLSVAGDDSGRCPAVRTSALLELQHLMLSIIDANNSSQRSCCSVVKQSADMAAAAAAAAVQLDLQLPATPAESDSSWMGSSDSDDSCAAATAAAFNTACQVTVPSRLSGLAGFACSSTAPVVAYNNSSGTGSTSCSNSASSIAAPCCHCICCFVAAWMPDVLSTAGAALKCPSQDIRR
jgi:hypothetical protein